MPERKDGRPPTKPSVNGIPALRGTVPLIDSPHIELLARVAVGGGVLTTRETLEVCAAVLTHIERERVDRPRGNPKDRPC